MLSLWSRATQAHHCGCRACGSATNALGRRATAATRHRKPTFAELFTACYSSVFATAAVVDAISKEDRRQVLDKQLEDARRQLTELKEQHVTSPYILDDEVINPVENQTRRRGSLRHRPAETAPQNAANPVDMEDGLLSIDDARSLQLSEARRELEEMRLLHAAGLAKSENDSEELGLTGAQRRQITRHLQTISQNRPFLEELANPVLHRGKLVPKLIARHYQGSMELRSNHRYSVAEFHRLEQLLIDEEHDASISTRQALTRPHLESERDAMRLLIRELMSSAMTLDSSGQPSPSFSEAQELLEGGYPSYTFRSVSPIEAQRSTIDLNRSLRSIVKSPELCLKEMIGRLCYNLLVAPHTPDTFTYNTLILALDKHKTLNRRYNTLQLSGLVVDSFYQKRLLKPTPATHEVMLNHFRVMNNHVLFYRILSRIVGLDKVTGAKMRRRRIDQIVESNRIRNWAADTAKRTVSGHYIWEHAPLSKSLVETVMSGLIYFNNLEHAASLFHVCVRTGVILSARVVRELLDGCVRALDWKCAASLVFTFARCDLERLHLMMFGEKGDFSYVLDRLRVLLDICGLHRGEQRPSKERLTDLMISPSRLDQLLETLELAVPEPAHEFLTLRNLQERHELGGLRSKRLQRASLEREVRVVQRKLHLIEATLIDPDYFSEELRLHMAEKISTHQVWRPSELIWKLTGLLPHSSADRLKQCKLLYKKQLGQEVHDQTPKPRGMEKKQQRREQQEGQRPLLRERSHEKAASFYRDRIIPEHIPLVRDLGSSRKTVEEAGMPGQPDDALSRIGVFAVSV